MINEINISNHTATVLFLKVWKSPKIRHTNVTTIMVLEASNNKKRDNNPIANATIIVFLDLKTKKSRHKEVSTET